MQFDLFGEPLAEKVAAAEKPPRETRAAAVLPAPAAQGAAALAASLPHTARFGTSSWSFAGWAGLVFADPPEPYSDTQLARQGLAAYAAHPLLRAVGIDRTFYAPIPESQYRAYVKQARSANPDFQFLVKAPMLFTGPRLRSDDGAWTDNPAFLNAHLATAQFVQPATLGLMDACGPLVFQFPPLGPKFTQGSRGPQRFADALAEFLLGLPKLAAPACYAVELRDAELLTEDYLAALCAGGATHCIGMHARMPSAAVQSRYWREAGQAPLVVRWSLHSGFKYEQAKERYAPFNALVDPDPAGRAEVAALVREAAAIALPSFVIINNKAEGSAPLSIRKLAELIAEHGDTLVVPPSV